MSLDRGEFRDIKEVLKLGRENVTAAARLAARPSKSDVGFLAAF